MSNRVERFCAAGGVVAAFGFGTALYIAGFIPPTKPSLSPIEVKDLILGNATRVKIGSMIMLICLTGFMTFYTGITLQMKRMGGQEAPRWAIVQMSLGALSLVSLIMSGLCWALAAFRPDRSPEAIQLLNDLAWFNCVVPAAPAFVQMVAIGVATLTDSRPDPIYPRWYGYMAFWVSILLMTGLLIPFFMHGPFAWNGLLAFWMPTVVLALFVLITCWLMVRASRR
jgi:hypothetical protein